MKTLCPDCGDTVVEITGDISENSREDVVTYDAEPCLYCQGEEDEFGSD